jgi:hypothetical protein
VKPVPVSYRRMNLGRDCRQTQTLRSLRAARIGKILSPHAYDSDFEHRSVGDSSAGRDQAYLSEATHRVGSYEVQSAMSAGLPLGLRLGSPASRSVDRAAVGGRRGME